MAFFVLPFSGSAQLSMPDIFSDNMVLQREKPIVIWGKYLPGEKLQIRLAATIQEAKTKADSTWQVIFPALPANATPQDLTVISKADTLEFSNILIGDVWLLAGQSNMEWSLGQELHFETEKKQLAGTQLRFYNPSYIGKGIYAEKYSEDALQKLKPSEFFQGKWQESQLPQVAELSAVGYYFGKEILQQEKIPIGLITIAIGGAPIEAFISEETFLNDSRFKKKISKNWLENDELPVWIRERGKQNVEGIAVQVTESGPNHAYKPGFIYKAGIEPLLKMPVKGVLWYQGESNAQEPERVREYAALQKLMIEDYRERWDNPELPFYWVQLSSIDTLNYDSHYWPEFRDEQRKLLDEIAHGGMAVSSDVGNRNDVHPRNKRAVGRRLARWALNQDYGQEIVASGPLPQKAEYTKGKVYITFDHATGLHGSGREKIMGFSFDGTSHVPGSIKGEQIILESTTQPEYVFYGWRPFSEGNLVNSAELPASTFKLKVEERIEN